MVFSRKVSRRLDLVYGGGSVGLMGLVSQEVHRGGGHVLGYYAVQSATFSSIIFGSVIICHILARFDVLITFVLFAESFPRL